MNTLSLDDGGSRFITLDDVARMLGISSDHAESLIASGELPAIRVGDGGPWRVERSVLESYIEALYEETRRRSLWNSSDVASHHDIP